MEYGQETFSSRSCHFTLLICAVILFGRQTDLPLVNADLIGAGRFGDPDFPVFDDQMVCAAGCTIDREFLIFCEIECLDDVSVDRDLDDFCRALMHQLCPEKQKSGSRKDTAIRIRSCFLKSVCFMSLFSVIKIS